MGPTGESFCRFMDAHRQGRTFFGDCLLTYAENASRSLRVNNATKVMASRYRGRKSTLWEDAEKGEVDVCSAAEFFRRVEGHADETQLFGDLSEIDELRDKTRQDDEEESGAMATAREVLRYLEHTADSVQGLFRDSGQPAPAAAASSSIEPMGGAMILAEDQKERAGRLWEQLKSKVNPWPITEIVTTPG